MLKWQTIRSSRIVLFIILAIGLPILHFTTILRPLENIFIRAVQPVQAYIYTKLNIAVDSNAEKNELEQLSPDELVKKNIELQDQIDNLTVENAHLKTVVEESSLLESQLQFLEDRSFTAVTARVSSRSTDSVSQSLIINKGSADGLQVGAPVIIDNGVLIGTVYAVQDHSSTVLLTISFDSRISASIQNATQSAGIVSGSHNLSLVMEYIPQFDAIAVDDPVFTNGTDEHIPEGLVIGRIQEVHTEPGSLFQEASVEPLYRPSEISIISVILP